MERAGRKTRPFLLGVRREVLRLLEFRNAEHEA